MKESCMHAEVFRLTDTENGFQCQACDELLYYDHIIAAFKVMPTVGRFKTRIIPPVRGHAKTDCGTAVWTKEDEILAQQMGVVL